MFASFKRALGMISVEERGRNIIVEGLPTDVFLGDVYRHWSTSKVEKVKLTRTTRSGIVFNKFFAIDILYIVETLKGEKLTRTPRRILDKLEEELLALTWLNKLQREDLPPRCDISKLSRIKIKPLPKQLEFIEHYNELVPKYNLKGYLLDSARGTGKTIGSLLWAESLVENEVTVCVVPNNAMHNVWLPTITDHFADRSDVWASADGNVPAEGFRYYVIHYDFLNKFMALNPWLSTKKVAIILDESHNMNNETSDRTNYFIRLCTESDSQNILWMSGTPIKQLGKECIPLLQTIDPIFDEDAKERFRKMYGKDAKRALDILSNRIGNIKFTVTKSEVIKEDVVPQVIRVKLPNGDVYTLASLKLEMSKFIDERLKFYLKGMRTYEERYLFILEIFERSLKDDRQRKEFALYRRYVQTIKQGYDRASMKLEVTYCNQYERKVIIPALPDGLKKEFRAVKSIYKYVELKVMGEALGGVLGRRRTECHLDMLDHIDFPKYIDPSEKKSLIFSSYVEVVDKLAGMLTEGGYQPLVVHAATNKNLTEIVSTFAKDPDANPLTATFQSLSTAVPLTMANTVLLLNSPFRDHEREQAIGRVDRLGQDAPIHAFEFFLDTGTAPNISTRSKDILQWSKEQVEMILGITGVDLDVTYESMLLQPYSAPSMESMVSFEEELSHLFDCYMGDL